MTKLCNGGRIFYSLTIILDCPKLHQGTANVNFTVNLMIFNLPHTSVFCVVFCKENSFYICHRPISAKLIYQ